MQEKQQCPIPVTKRKLLMVEGKDEVNFFEEFFKHLEINDVVDIREVRGKDNFRNQIPALISKVSGSAKLEKVAIIRDADESSMSAFESIKGILKANNFKGPEKPGEFSGDNPRIGVFIMPDNKNNGMLENLCLESIKGDSGLECVDKFIDCANQFENRLKEKDIAKAKVQAFLSIVPEVPNSIGVGAKKGVWNFDSPQLQPLIDFLSQLK